MGNRLGGGGAGGGGRRLADSDLQILSQRSQLQPFVVQQLYAAFMDRAGKDGRMTINQFKQAFFEINPTVNMYTADNDAERIFMMFDTDRNGLLSFDEFMMAYIQMQRGLVF